MLNFGPRVANLGFFQRLPHRFGTLFALICTLACSYIAFHGAPATAANFEDMVLVRANRPFYIDIFEANGSQISAAIPAHASTGRSKPARIVDARQARDYCAKIGKRIPTLDEWKQAASNAGRNKRYTLVGDVLKKGTKLLANVAGAGGNGSATSTDSAVVGIDAVGTLGLTGNRPEWVMDSKGNFTQCGGGYENTDEDSFQLPNICSIPKADSATVRCVVDANLGVTISFTAAIDGPLASYLKQAGQVAGPFGNAVAAPSNNNNNRADADPDDPPTDIGAPSPVDGAANSPAVAAAPPAPPPEPKYDDEFTVNPDYVPPPGATAPDSDDYLVLYREAAEAFGKMGLDVEAGVYAPTRGILNTRKDLITLVNGGTWVSPFVDGAAIVAGHPPGTVPNTRGEVWAVRNNQYYLLQNNAGKVEALLKGVPFRVQTASEGLFLLTKDKKVAYLPKAPPKDLRKVKTFGHVPAARSADNFMLTLDGSSLIFLANAEKPNKGLVDVLVLKPDGTLTTLMQVQPGGKDVAAAITSEAIMYASKAADPKDPKSHDTVGKLQLRPNGLPDGARDDNFYQLMPKQELFFQPGEVIIRAPVAKGGRERFRLFPDGSLRAAATGGAVGAEISAAEMTMIEAAGGQDWTATARAGNFDSLIDRGKYVEAILGNLRGNKTTWVNLSGEFGAGKTEIAKLVARYAATAGKREWPKYKVVYIPMKAFVEAGGGEELPPDATVTRRGNEDSKDPALADAINKAMAEDGGAPGMGAGAMMGGAMGASAGAIVQMLKGKAVIVVLDDFLDDPALGPTNVQKAMETFDKAFREAIAKAEIRVITTSEIRHWQTALSDDPQLHTRVNEINVTAPSEAELALIVHSKMEEFERQYRVKFDVGSEQIFIGSAGEADPLTIEPLRSVRAVEKVARQAGNAEKQAPVRMVNSKQIRAILIDGDGSASGRIDAEGLRTYLGSAILGQDDALDRIVNSVRALSLGAINRNGPRGLIFLTGPTGTGKTESAKLLSKFLKLPSIKIDMTAFNGFGEDAKYTKDIRNLGNRDFVLILDDLDKSKNAADMLVQLRPVFDTGIYGEGSKDELNLRSAIIIITANYGARAVLALQPTDGQPAKPSAYEDLVQAVEKEVFSKDTPERERIPPHVWSRLLDSLVVFQGLDTKTLSLIAQRTAEKFSTDFQARWGVSITVDKTLIAKLVGESSRTDLGAVPIQRTIDNRLKPLVEAHLRARNAGAGTEKGFVGIKHILVMHSSTGQIVLLDDTDPNFAHQLSVATSPPEETQNGAQP